MPSINNAITVQIPDEDKTVSVNIDKKLKVLNTEVFGCDSPIDSEIRTAKTLICHVTNVPRQYNYF